MDKVSLEMVKVVFLIVIFEKVLTFNPNDVPHIFDPSDPRFQEIPHRDFYRARPPPGAEPPLYDDRGHRVPPPPDSPLKASLDFEESKGKSSDLYDLEEKLTKSGKWNEFLTKLKESGEKAERGEIKDWKDDADKWADWAHKLGKPNLRISETTQRSIVRVALSAEAPSPGMGMYWENHQKGHEVPISLEVDKDGTAISSRKDWANQGYAPPPPNHNMQQFGYPPNNPDYGAAYGGASDHMEGSQPNNPDYGGGFGGAHPNLMPRIPPNNPDFGRGYDGVHPNLMPRMSQNNPDYGSEYGGAPNQMPRNVGRSRPDPQNFQNRYSQNFQNGPPQQNLRNGQSWQSQNGQSQQNFQNGQSWQFQNGPPQHNVQNDQSWQFQNGPPQQNFQKSQSWQFQNGPPQQNFQNGQPWQSQNVQSPNFQNEQPPYFKNEPPPNYQNAQQPKFQNEQPPNFHSLQPPNFQNEQPPNFHSLQPPNFQNELPPNLENELPLNYQKAHPRNFNRRQPKIFENEQPDFENTAVTNYRANKVPVTTPHTPRTTVNPLASYNLPEFDDFSSPIRWVKYNSIHIKDGFAKVTDPDTGTNRQYNINGTIYVPIIDENIERLGFTTEPTNATLKTKDKITWRKNLNDNPKQLHTENEQSWLEEEFSRYQGLATSINRCLSPTCKARCDKPYCRSFCRGYNCTSGCLGAKCRSKCAGEGCKSLCLGEMCQSLCNGVSCDSRCRGWKCDNKCSGFYCYTTNNGYIRQGTAPEESTEDLSDRDNVNYRVKNVSNLEDEVNRQREMNEYMAVVNELEQSELRGNGLKNADDYEGTRDYGNFLMTT